VTIFARKSLIKLHSFGTVNVQHGLPLSGYANRSSAYPPGDSEALAHVGHVPHDVEALVRSHRVKRYWIKVKNSRYSQLEGREELFERV
jgi:hypothetical protein